MPNTVHLSISRNRMHQHSRACLDYLLISSHQPFRGLEWNISYVNLRITNSSLGNNNASLALSVLLIDCWNFPSCLLIWLIAKTIDIESKLQEPIIKAGYSDNHFLWFSALNIHKRLVIPVTLVSYWEVYHYYNYIFITIISIT